jgi:hypothetical protein
MKKLKALVGIVAMTSIIFAAHAIAQVQAPPSAGERPSSAGALPSAQDEKTVEGQVKSVHPSGTEITLTDGTKLVTPPGTSIKSGALMAGDTVVASYREENGQKVLTELTVHEPSASPRTGPTPPSGPPVAPPGESPKRY